MINKINENALDGHKPDDIGRLISLMAFNLERLAEGFVNLGKVTEELIIKYDSAWRKLQETYSELDEMKYENWDDFPN